MEYLRGLRSFRFSHVSHQRRVILLLQCCAFVTLLFILNTTPIDQGLPGIEHLLRVLLIWIGAHFFLSIVRILFVSSYRVRMHLAQDEQDNFTLGLTSLVSVLSFLIGIIGIFVVYDIDFFRVWTSLALFSVAISWVAKEYITNFIDSFILMFSTDYRIGEYIKINEDQKGVIKDITFRATKIRTDEGDTLYIPNSILLNEEVTNYSKTRLKRITVPFAAFRNTVDDLTSYEQKLKHELCKAFPDLVEEDQVYLRVLSITNDSVSMALEVGVSTYSFKIEEDIKKWVSVYVLATA